jgi:hypothetical protein
MKSDERRPEVEFAPRLVQHPAGDLGEPEIDTTEGGEHNRAEQHVMEMRHHEVGVGDMPVDRRGR